MGRFKKEELRVILRANKGDRYGAAPTGEYPRVTIRKNVENVIRVHGLDLALGIDEPEFKAKLRQLTDEEGCDLLDLQKAYDENPDLAFEEVLKLAGWDE